MKLPRHLKVAGMAMGAVLLSARPVYAEDIEIYLVPGSESGGANVLMVIDTSGGTNRRFPGTSYSPDGNKTIDEISFALRNVIDGLAGSTRVGVSSQLAGGADGGAINYAVLQIDESSDPLGYARVSAEDRDAIQWFKTPTTPLPVNSGMISWDTIDVASESFPIPSILSTGEAENVVGFQLSGLSVPRYAQIDSAVLTMRSPTGGSRNFRARMAHELSSNPAPFSPVSDFPARNWSLPLDSGGSSFNVKGRLDAGVISIDVTDIVQGAVADPLWCGGNTLSMMIQGTDINVGAAPLIYSYRAEDADESRLGVTEIEVRWNPAGMAPVGAATGDDALSCMGGVSLALAATADDGSETMDAKNLQTNTNSLVLENVTTGPAARRGNYIGGARYAGVGFPKDTKVKSATLQGRFTAANGAGALLRVRPMLGDVPAFESNGDISSRPTGSKFVDIPAVVGDFSADVTALVNEIFSDGSWAANSALGLRFERQGGSLIGVHALDGGAASAPILKLDVLAPKPGDFISTITRRDEMKVAVDKFSNATGGGKNKPASAYVEAARYMLGLPPLYGKAEGHEEAFTNATRNQYLSPTQAYDECGGSHIILVTHAESAGESFKAAVDSLTKTTDCKGDGNSDAWQCSSVVASYLADAKRNDLNIPITTHTVAFAPQQAATYAGLKQVAAAGGGQYRESEDAQELAQVLSDLINSLTTTDASMAAPGVAVNQLNRFRHLDQLYYALFRPSLDTRWEGNLKRYRLDFARNPPAIVDEKNQPAVDPDTGFFRENSNSWWGLRDDGTDEDDGQNVGLGGAREELEFNPKPRNLLVAPGSPGAGGSATATTKPAGLDLVSLASAADITAGKLGMAGGTADDIQERVDFLLSGWGDPLHSEPRLVNFGFTGTFEEAVLDDSKQDNVVFVTTNDGMLHAIDPPTGKELFTFMPADELAKTEKRFQNGPLDAADPQRSTYGLDGGITVWRRAKQDGSGNPEHVFLYMGQRRGGNSYYALDVTNRAKPKLMWQIDGGVAPFNNLGQTWSLPTLAQIMLNGQKVPVLIFGGGYSPEDHDTIGAVSGGDSKGNSIFIVNAYNGALIWSASRTGATENHADMRWAIPSSVSVVDVDFDGVIDHLYAADLGGQVFRVDLDPDNTGAGSLAKRIVTLAKLGTSDGGGIANHRRFHASPVVALSRRGGELVLQVVLGSGYRSHPLNMDTQDRIFAVDDVDVLHDRHTGTVTLSDMLNVTTNLSPSEADLASKRGWYISLEKGEKVLSSATVTDGVMFISSFLPESSFINKCQRVIGSSRLYAVNVLDGSPVLDLDNSGDLDRSVDLNLPGLPPSPQLLLGPDSEQVVLIGTSALSAGEAGGLGLRKTRWYEVPTEDAAQKILNEAMKD